MKKLLNYITAALFLSLFVFASCGGSDPGEEEEDPLDLAAEKFVGTFNADVVTPEDGLTNTLDWETFELTMTGNKSGGTFSTKNSPDANVWPASGSWTFDGTTGTKILRNDDVVMTISGSIPNIVVTFTVSSAPNKVSKVNGEWSFELVVVSASAS